MSRPQNFLPAPLSKRLAAMLYDSLLILALIMLVGALWLPLNSGKAIEPNNPLYLPMIISVLLTPSIFYIFFWLKGGQTLGMRAWRLRVQQLNGQKITFKQALLRALTAIVSFACFGLGIFWMAISPSKSMWHDLLSKTEIILIPKNHH